MAAPLIPQSGRNLATGPVVESAQRIAHLDHLQMRLHPAVVDSDKWQKAVQELPRVTPFDTRR